MSFGLSEKAFSSIVVILFGNCMPTFLSVKCSLNAFAPILVTPGISGKLRIISSAALLINIDEPVEVKPLIESSATTKSSSERSIVTALALAVIERLELSENKENVPELSGFRGGVSKESVPVATRATASPQAIRLLKKYFFICVLLFLKTCFVNIYIYNSILRF